MLSNAQFVDADQQDFIESQFSSPAVSYRTSGDELDLRHLCLVERVMYLQVLVLGNMWVPLRQILKIEVDPGEDFAFVVFAPAVGIGGTGDTVNEAIKSLSENIQDMWEALRETPLNELHHTAKSRLERLHAFLSE